LLFLFGLGLVSAVSSANRSPLASPVLDPALDVDGEERLSLAWGPEVPWALAEQGLPFAELPPLRIVNVNSRQAATIALYDTRGRVDEDAAKKLDELLADARDPDNVHVKELDRRVLQLIYRAAYHFRSKVVEVISAYRSPGSRDEGRHGAGRAVDFRFTNVSAAALASYLRQIPRAGVGMYTHPATHFVHLDDRDRSYHWVDASPPGRHWRLRPVFTAGAAHRDAAYAPKTDWPEGTMPSPLAIALQAPPPEATSTEASAE
jgi:uncharacterized protein YcbK (DUF882 family)